MLKTVGVVRERERERELELKTRVFSFDAKSIRNTRKIYNKINRTRIKNKRIDCLVKVENSLSFLCAKDKYA